MKFKRWIHQEPLERRVLAEVNEFWDNNPAVRKQICEPVLVQSDTVPLLNEAVKIGLQIKAQLEHKKKKKLNLHISPVHDLLHTLDKPPSTPEEQAEFIRSVVHALFKKTNKAYEGNLSKQDLDSYIDRAYNLYHQVRAEGHKAVKQLAESIGQGISRLAQRWDEFTKTKAFTNAEEYDDPAGTLTQRTLSTMRAFERSLNHLLDEIDRTEMAYLTASSAATAAANAAVAAAAQAEGDSMEEKSQSQGQAEAVSMEEEAKSSVEGQDPPQVSADDVMTASSPAPIVEEPVEPIVEEPSARATKPTEEDDPAPAAADSAQSADDPAMTDRPSDLPDIQSNATEDDDDTTTTSQAEDEADEDEEDEAKANQEAIVTIQRVRDDVAQVDDQFDTLRAQADELNLDKLTETPLKSAKHVEKLTYKCLGLSENLLRELFKLDGLVVANDEIRKERKATVNHIQAMLDDCDRLKQRLRTLSKTLEPLAEQERRRMEEEAHKKAEADAKAAATAGQVQPQQTQQQKQQKKRAKELRDAYRQFPLPGQKIAEEDADEEDEAEPQPEKEQEEDSDASSLASLWKLLKLKPRFDVQETPRCYVIRAYLPNMKPSNFNVKLNYAKARTRPTDAVARASQLLPERLQRHVSGEVGMQQEPDVVTGFTISGTRMPTPQEEAALLERVNELRRRGHPQLNSREAVEELLLRMGSGRFGTFSQEFALPEDADPEAMQASYQDDCFKLVIGKLPLDRAYLARQQELQRQQQMLEEQRQRARQLELLRQQQEQQRRYQPHFVGLGMPFSNTFFGDRDLWW